ncbi:MAG: O-antigen ligase family protein [Pseudomonadota bacterium]
MKKSLLANSQFWAVAAILVAAFAFGGGGSRYGMSNLLVQFTALGALAFHREAFFTFWSTASRPLKFLVLASIVLPFLYIIPLPPSVWQALPGRELVQQSFDLLPGEDSASVWATASVEPVRTGLALTALIVPLALLTIGWSARREQLITIGWIAVGLGLINFLIGIPQVLTNSASGVLYPENPMPGVLFGTFANRNSTALFLVGALTLAMFLPTPLRSRRASLAARVVICLLLLVAIILTRSRTGLVLALVPIGLLTLRLIWARLQTAQRTTQPRSRTAWLVAAPAVVAVAAVAAVVTFAPGRASDVIDRFQTERTDSRAYIWEDATYAAGQYWPVGSGTGTFDDVFQVSESLENMTLRKAGRAHNDYIELAIETGIPGIALALAWIAYIIWLCWQCRGSRDRWIAWSGAIILAIIAAQSITDYPLRNFSMMSFATLALLLLVRFGQEEGRAKS